MPTKATVSNEDRSKESPLVRKRKRKKNIFTNEEH